nr:hypothetical protein CFP56_12952 [Quercus suber]
MRTKTDLSGEMAGRRSRGWCGDGMINSDMKHPRRVSRVEIPNSRLALRGVKWSLSRSRNVSIAGLVSFCSRVNNKTFRGALKAARRQRHVVARPTKFLLLTERHRFRSGDSKEGILEKAVRKRESGM